MVNEVHHHHHHLYLPYFDNKKNLFTALTARRRGDQEDRRAYGRATSLIIIYQVKEKCCECRDYLSKISCIFFLKRRRFDKRVTGTGRELQI